MQARGFELAPGAGSSKATLQFRGDMVLMGGLRFHKGITSTRSWGSLFGFLISHDQLRMLAWRAVNGGLY